jgi:rod shape-determining protein MreC
LLSIFLLSQERHNNRLDGIRAFLSVIIYPVQFLVNLPIDVSESVSTSLSSYAALQKENDQLRHEQLIDKNKLLKFASLEKENIRLRALLENSFKLGEQVLIAELLSVNFEPYEHIVLVNKGTRFSVHPKQPVLDAHGVVGQVIRSNPLTSEIMLITDPNHAIPVQVNRNGLSTIAVGSGKLNHLSLPFLPNNADIVPGDLLITSGLGGVSPQGYPVAVVDTITPQPDKPFANIFATPKALLDRNQELLIVWSNSKPVLFTVTPDTEPVPSEELRDSATGTNNVN